MSTVLFQQLMVNRAIKNLVIISSVSVGYSISIYAGQAKLKPILFKVLKVEGIRE